MVGVPGLEFVESRPLGGAWLLDGLWHRLGIDTLLRRLAAGTRRDPVVERVLFALVANRALAPSSKLAATSWVAHDVHLPGLTGGHGVRRRLLPGDGLAHQRARTSWPAGCSTPVAHLLNLEVDLIFFDTTSTYFETEQPDEPVWRDQHGRVVDADTDTTHRPRRRHRRRRRDGGEADGECAAGGRDGAGGVPHATGSPRTPATTCPRSWSGWP